MLNSESNTKYRKPSIVLSIRFLLVGEGSFDRGLVDHLERCCVLAGADEASGVAPDLSRLPRQVGQTVAAKLEAALKLEPSVDFVFLHRDADSRDSRPRHEEILRAVEGISVDLRYVAVVPVQETEAWLLLDEGEIRTVAENPNGSVHLNVPTLHTVENIADPKAYLDEAILNASEQSGRHQDRIRKRLSQKKTLLIRRLDAEGPVSRVPAWIKMFSDLKSLIEELKLLTSLTLRTDYRLNSG